MNYFFPTERERGTGKGKGGRALVPHEREESDTKQLIASKREKRLWGEGEEKKKVPDLFFVVFRMEKKKKRERKGGSLPLPL